MQEWIIGMLVRAMLGAMTTDQMQAVVAKWGTALKEKVDASPEKWDDALLDAYISSADGVATLADFAIDILEDMIAESKTTLDNVIVLPIIQRLREVFNIQDLDAK